MSSLTAGCIGIKRTQISYVRTNLINFSGIWALFSFDHNEMMTMHRKMDQLN